MFDKKKWGLKIRGKIALGNVVILLILGLLLIIVSGRISDLEQETVFLSDHDIEVHELTYRIEKNVLDMETGQRGYALTGNTEYLVPYNTGLVEWYTSYTKLNALIADNPAQIQILNEIRDNIELWVDKSGQHVVDLKQNGQDDAVEAFYHNDSGKLIIDSIRSQSELFRENEKMLTNHRIELLKEGNSKLQTSMYLLWAIATLIGIATTLIISHSIVQTIRKITGAIDNIAGGGKMSERIEVRTSDEIHELGNSTNRLLEMMEREQWSSEQLSAMSLALKETSDLTLLCQTFLNKTAAMFGIQYGVIYVLNNNEELERKHSYAGSGNNELGPAILMPGEGLVGQCALNMRMTEIDDLPQDYISIHSGLGSAAPRYAVIAPIIFENQTVAVVEIASLTKWAAYQLKLLAQLTNIMGVTVHSVMTRVEIQKLYMESQVMNEELQVQSEELQTQAEELQSFTKELLTLNGELENQKLMAEHTSSELEKYNEQLKLSSTYKSEFLANMSHELRTPLNSMLILSQLIAENRNDKLTEEEKGYASVIYSSGTDLLAMINDILDLSKVEAGKMQVEMDRVNLTELPLLLKEYFGKIAEQKELEFSVVLDSSAPDLFYTDEMRLHQILRNLLSNALKFTEQGSVKLEVSRLQSVITPQFQSDEPVLAFTVKDSGIGIAEENFALIFESFRQADGSTVRKFGGTGLGLSISLQLARLLGGDIVLQSTVGEGSEFTLYLPCGEEEGLEYESVPMLAEAAASMDQMESGSSSAMSYDKERLQLQGKTVLIVDDDMRNLYALKQGLEPYAMNIITAQTGCECLQLMRERSDLDIILLDIMMPHMDGYDTLAIIKEDQLLPKVPIIAISAKTMKEDREKCLAAGANDFLSKPVSIQDVVSRMCRWLTTE